MYKSLIEEVTCFSTRNYSHYFALLRMRRSDDNPEGRMRNAVKYSSKVLRVDYIQRAMIYEPILDVIVSK